MDAQLEPDKGTSDASKAIQKKYTRGNKAARYILLNSISPQLVQNLFREDSAVVGGAVIWKRLTDHFVQKDATRKYIAVNNFFSFQCREEKTAYENLMNFKGLQYELEQASAGLKEDVVCITLINKLPASWSWVKQSWLQKLETERKLANLSDMILAEAARRESEKASQQRGGATALTARFFNRRNPSPLNPNRRNQQGGSKPKPRKQPPTQSNHQGDIQERFNVTYAGKQEDSLQVQLLQEARPYSAILPESQGG